MNILIIEDDKVIANSLKEEFLKWNYEVDIVEDFSNVLLEFNKEKHKLILLDVNLPFNNGFTICTEIRKVSKVPIIFVSSRDSSMDIVMAISLGGDDYITKPIDLTLLLAKVQALLRRSYDYSENLEVLTYKDVTLNYGESSLSYKEEKISLTKTELMILKELFLNKGNIVEREKIMEKCWLSDDYIDDNTLAVNITRLIKKLKEINLIDFIKTKKNYGYYLNNGE